MMPVIHFGPLNKKPVDWRRTKDAKDPDDEELEKTPKDVVGMLGFDPLEELD